MRWRERRLSHEAVKVMGHAGTFSILSDFSRVFQCQYWLEAGTALAAHRDGKIFDWEHDIDIGVWYEEIKDIEGIAQYFAAAGYVLEIQKGFPYLDNIIQLRSRKPELLDIDIYLYKKCGEYAYMRWIQKPEGLLATTKKRLLFGLRSFVNPITFRSRLLAQWIPFRLRVAVFNAYLKLHLATSSCRFHRFPLHFFSNLRTIEFYGAEVPIAADTDAFLEYRYGADWRVPNDTFNQRGLWKSVPARPLLHMSVLAPPVPLDTRKFRGLEKQA